MDPTAGDDAAMQLVHQLRALTMELDLLGAEFARTRALHPTDLRALIHLLDAERASVPATPGWLAAQLGLDVSSVTAVVGRLEKAGHLRRHRDPSDGRRVLLDVDAGAVELGWSFFGPLITNVVRAVRELRPDQIDTVRAFLAAVAAALDEQRRRPEETRRDPGPFPDADAVTSTSGAE